VQVPAEHPCIIIGHEFLDALPVHIFRKDPERGWLEVLVDEPPSPTSSRVRPLLKHPQKAM
jgi:SAM-dependent MidA family methyltransferase